MKNKQKKWEKEFEKWTNGEYDDIYDELAKKYERDAFSEEEAKNRYTEPQKYEEDVKKRKENARNSKEEYNKYKKMRAIKNNINKVKNIAKYKKDMEKKLGIVNEELKRREKVRDFNKEREDLEKENADLLTEIDEINTKLKSKNLSEEDRKKYENDKRKNIEKRKRNNEKFMENQQKMENNIDKDNKDISKWTDEELKSEKLSLSTKISKCNMACNNLMQGKSWEAIEAKLDNWKNYKGKKGQAEELKNNVEHDEKNGEDNSQRNENNNEDKQTPKEQAEELKGKEEKEEKALVEYKSFSERHPILAKIPFLAKIVDKLNKSKNEKDMQENDEVINDTSESLGKEVGKILDEDSKEEKNQNEEFKKYLKEIADKGMDGIKKEKMERARVLLAQNKVNKANEYAEKYGSRYNEQDGANKNEGQEL